LKIGLFVCIFLSENALRKINVLKWRPSGKPFVCFRLLFVDLFVRRKRYFLFDEPQNEVLSI
jgi:hypothetical protein